MILTLAEAKVKIGHVIRGLRLQIAEKNALPDTVPEAERDAAAERKLAMALMELLVEAPPVQVSPPTGL